MKRALTVAAFLVSALSVSPIYADLPPEPGFTKVSYTYRLESAVEGRSIVAFPTYNTKDEESYAVVLEAGKDAGTWQGYQPGLYSLTTSDAQNLPKGEDAEKAFLASHAALCLKHVPRVF